MSNMLTSSNINFFFFFFFFFKLGNDIYLRNASQNIIGNVGVLSERKLRKLAKCSVVSFSEYCKGGKEFILGRRALYLTNFA